MAVPVPRTYVASEFETATILNGDIRDTHNFLLAPPRVSVYKSADSGTIATATWALVTFDSEVYDPYTPAAHSTSSNTSRLIAAETGIYFVSLKLRWDVNSGGNRLFELRKNAAGSQSGGTLLETSAVGAIATNTTTHSENFDVPLNATDYIELFAFQSSAGGLVLVGGITGTRLQMRWIAKS